MRGVQGPLFREKKARDLLVFGFKNTRTAPVSERRSRTHSLRSITLLTLLFSPVARRYLEAPRLEVSCHQTAHAHREDYDDAFDTFISSTRLLLPSPLLPKICSHLFLFFIEYLKIMIQRLRSSAPCVISHTAGSITADQKVSSLEAKTVRSFFLWGFFFNQWRDAASKAPRLCPVRFCAARSPRRRRRASSRSCSSP